MYFSLTVFSLGSSRGDGKISVVLYSQVNMVGLGNTTLPAAARAPSHTIGERLFPSCPEPVFTAGAS